MGRLARKSIFCYVCAIWFEYSHLFCFKYSKTTGNLNILKENPFHQLHGHFKHARTAVGLICVLICQPFCDRLVLPNIDTASVDPDQRLRALLMDPTASKKPAIPKVVFFPLSFSPCCHVVILCEKMTLSFPLSVCVFWCISALTVATLLPQVASLFTDFRKSKSSYIAHHFSVS